MDNASLPAIPSNIGEIAAQLMSNPQIMNIMNGMNNYAQADRNRSDNGQDTDGSGQSDGGDIARMMGRLMSDPQVMGLIGTLGGMQSPKAGSAVSDSGGGVASEERGGPDRPDKPDVPDKPYISDKPDGGDRKHIRAGSDRDRIALLCALKPYLGDGRRKKIEGMLKVLELVEFARTTHLLENILPGFGDR